MVTEAGPVRDLAEAVDSETTRSIVRRVELSIEAHGSAVVAVVAHEDCAGNPTDREHQVGQLAESTGYLADRFPQTSVLGLWVDEHGEVTNVCAHERERV
jgi:carbonic anhydrase